MAHKRLDYPGGLTGTDQQVETKAKQTPAEVTEVVEEKPMPTKMKAINDEIAALDAKKEPSRQRSKGWLRRN
ncbi:MAG: hypothetical protein ACXV3D_07750 [Halobacteriota archaeon]